MVIVEPREVYVIVAGYGEYSDRSINPVCVVESKDVAQAMMKELERAHYVCHTRLVPDAYGSMRYDHAPADAVARAEARYREILGDKIVDSAGISGHADWELCEALVYDGPSALNNKAAP
jgi:hypothetical protein